MPDWGWIIVAAVVVFGASKLPEIARNLGRSSGEFKKGLKEGDEVKPMPPADAAATSPTPTPPASAPTEPPRTETRPETTP
jgi:sec-independent protein translocase protein TatA